MPNAARPTEKPLFTAAERDFVTRIKLQGMRGVVHKVGSKWEVGTKVYKPGFPLFATRQEAERMAAKHEVALFERGRF